MIAKNTALAGVKQITYYIEIERPVVGDVDPEKPIEYDKKECILNTPDFDQMLQAMSLIKDHDNCHYMKAGRAMFNLCAVSYDEAFKDNNNMASLALELCIELVAPQTVEVKKKSSSIDM